MIVFTLVLRIVALLLCALAARSAARSWHGRASLPEGKVLYSDTGREKRPSGTFVSVEHGLKGRPDYLVETTDGIIPVEIKSTTCPHSGRPYNSHMMQLACYCLLCEETMNAHVPFGLIRYCDREVRVPFTPELRVQLLSLLEEMRSACAMPIVHRSYSQARRCAKCGFKDICSEALYL